MGQQPFGSMPTCVAHAQTGIIGQATGADAAAQTGQAWMGQQLTGSVPTATGCTPPAQAGSSMGQATGCEGSHAVAGTHWLVQLWPEQPPAASQLHVAPPGGQAHVLVVPAAAAQPQPTHAVSHRSPAGHSASVVHGAGGG